MCEISYVPLMNQPMYWFGQNVKSTIEMGYIVIIN